MRVVVSDVVVGDWGLGMRVVIGDWWLVISEAAGCRAVIGDWGLGISEAPITNHQSPSEAPTTNHQPPITNHQSPTTPSRRRRSFTLVELLITVSIIAIMASMILFALYAAQEQARVQKTRALIAKLNNIIRDRYDSYRTRRLPFPRVNDVWIDVNKNGMWDGPFTDRFPYDANGNKEPDAPFNQTQIAKMRLDMLRDVMRMEMPDRWSDVYDQPLPPPLNPVPSGSPPTNWPAHKPLNPTTLSSLYRIKYKAVTNQPDIDNLTLDSSKEDFQNAECLYMIVMEAVAQIGDSREVFKPADVGDVDGDGFPEFIDAWGMPIRFLRWAPGFISEVQTLAQTKPTNLPPPPDPQTVILEFPAARFSTSPGDYLFGAMAVLTPEGQIDGARLARITGYTNDGITATFTCTATAPAQPFNGNKPTSNADTVAIMAPDPFDPRGLYPDYTTNHLTPTWALYPLVYSAGPDKEYGIVDHTTAELRYIQVGMNPFYVPASGEMMGTRPAGNTGPATDNIHNHQLNMR